MAKIDLKLDNLGELSMGAFGSEVDMRLMQAVQDVHNRPFLKGKRKVVIEIELEPAIDNTGLAGISIIPSVSLKVPNSRGTSEYIHTKVVQGGLEAYIITDQQGSLLESEGN